MYECEMGLSKSEKMYAYSWRFNTKNQNDKPLDVGVLCWAKPHGRLGKDRYDHFWGEASIDFQIATFARLFTGWYLMGQC